MKIEAIIVKVGTPDYPTTTEDQNQVRQTFSDRLEEDYPGTPITVVPEHSQVQIVEQTGLVTTL